MASLQLKFVQQFVDRHGHPPHYFRRPGFTRRALPGLPGSPEFMAAYTEAMAGQPPAVIGRPDGVPLREFNPGTMNALAVSYFSSRDFRSLAPSTQTAYRSIIDRLCREDGNSRVAHLQRKFVVGMMAQRSTPESANGLRKALRAMMKHAVEIGMREDDPTLTVKRIPVKSDGFHSWTDDEIAQFELQYPIGTKGRLALALLLYSGQRRSDVVRLGSRDIRDGFLRIKQEKTGTELSLLVLPELQEIIAASTVGLTTFLVNDLGQPFTARRFGRWFREQCNKAGLPPYCSAHGLRKAAARMLAEAGCTEHEIAAITGHASLQEVRRYTKAANQKHLATAAAQKLMRAK
jgi:integrase